MDDDSIVGTALSRGSALAPLFRGRFCDVVLGGRPARVFEEDAVLYEMAARERTFFFLRTGIVKIGTITAAGREIIYDLRKDRDVVGELCAIEPVRRDRAVAVERTCAIAVPFEEVMEALAQHPALLRDFVAMFCHALADAHEQVNRLAADDVMPRLVGVLKTLAVKLGRPAGQHVEIGAYLTQEEVAQMVKARRERVSTALNALRRRGIAQYSTRGRLILDMRALDDYVACLT
jgi:CRP-like cAMP-binding protein